MAEHKTPKNKGGRPTKKDEKTIGILKEIFEIDGTVAEACSQAGIDVSTYYDWLKQDEEFSKTMKRAQDYVFILARKTLVNGMRNGESKSAIEMLRRRDRRYKDKQDVTSADEKISFSVVNYGDEKNDTV